jgi:tetratricopeptide (TPR) repeat protein
MNDARESARELMRVGRQLNDPRSTGFGLVLLMWIALTSNSWSEALEYSEQALAVAVTPLDRVSAMAGKGCALVLLRRTDEGAALLEELRRRSVADGYLYLLTVIEPFIGLCEVLEGNMSEGIRLIEEAKLRQEKKGNRRLVSWYEGFLSEVYLQIIGGNERVPFTTLLKNLPCLLTVMITASSRIRAFATSGLENPYYDPEGQNIGHWQMVLGLLYKSKKKRALALQHLTEAKRILSQFGQTRMLARVETALAELG